MNPFGSVAQSAAKLLRYSTPVSHCWWVCLLEREKNSEINAPLHPRWVVNFVFRAMVVFVIGSGIYGDEQVSSIFSISFDFYIFHRAPSDVILDSRVVKTCVSTSSRQCTILDSGLSRFVLLSKHSNQNILSCLVLVCLSPRIHLWSCHVESRSPNQKSWPVSIDTATR